MPKYLKIKSIFIKQLDMITSKPIQYYNATQPVSPADKWGLPLRSSPLLPLTLALGDTFKFYKLTQGGF